VLTFIETKLFTRLVQNYFTDDEYAELQNAIVANPEAGDLIRGSGGVRKLRGAWPGAESEAVFGSSTTCDCSRVKCGC
jgi:hypothetical protein